MNPATRHVILGLALLLGACTASSAAVQAPTLALRGDGRLVELAVEAGPTSLPDGAIDRERAIALAAAQLSAAPPAGASDGARLVHLTVRAADGGATLLPRRLTWLVPFRGVEFETPLCAWTRRAATAVAVDALDGRVLGSYGVDGWARGPGDWLALVDARRAPERVVFVEAGATDKKAAALEANEVDGQPSLAVDAFMKVREKNRNAIGWLDEPLFAWIDPCPATLGFNNELAPWNDPQMRWAVNLGIDKKKLADAYGFGFGMPARYNFPFYAPLESILNENNDLFQKYNVLEHNPRKAMEMIEGRGYKKGADGVYARDGQPLKVDLLVKAAAVTQPTVSLLVTFMKSIGIDAAPQALADTQYHDRRNRADFQMETTHVACGSVVDPFAELNLLDSQWIRAKGEVRSNNLWGYKNPEYDAVVDKIRLLPPGDAGLKPLTRQALEMRLRDLPFVPLAQQFRVVPYSTKYWTNWPTAKNNYFHPPNWWNCFLIPVLNIKPA